MSSLNRHIHDVYMSTPRLQLEFRRKHYSVPLTAPFLHPSHKLSVQEKIAALEDREKRLNAIQPKSLDTIVNPGCEFYRFQDGHILYLVDNPDQPDMNRNSKRENGEVDEDDEDDWEDEDEDDLESEYSSGSTSTWEETIETLTSGVGGLHVQKQLTRKNGWEVYWVKGTASNEEAKARGGIQRHGHWSWKFDMGKNFDRIDMCVKDNVLISVEEGLYYTKGTEKSTASTYDGFLYLAQLFAYPWVLEVFWLQLCTGKCYQSNETGTR